MKVKKIKSHSASKSLVAIIISIILTLALFVGLIYLNNYVSRDISYKTVIVAKEDIPRNLYITKENT